MTGIERLHKLIADIDVSADPELWYILREGTEGDWDCEEHDDKTLDSTLADIADQIEREQGEHVSRMRVLAVVTEMERHASGVEGMEDSPVARWARELREALGGDGSDHAVDVSVSAYDLLPQDDREAIAWVREHGGLGAVKRRWECLSYYADPVPRSCMEKRLARLQRQIDECHEALRRKNQRIEELGHRVSDLTNENAELRKRLMPEGLEWPRYESGELVNLGDRYECWCGKTHVVSSVSVRKGCSVLNASDKAHAFIVSDGLLTSHGKRVKRPVLASDDEPLEVGQTVWHTATGREYTVRSCTNGGAHLSRDGKPAGYCRADYLTHHRPVLDADGVPIKVGDTVWMVGDPDGPYRVTKVTTKYATHVHGYSDELGDLDMSPSQLTHERPDSLDRLAEDIGAMVVAWRSNRDLFDAQEAAAGCVGENTLGAALDSLARRAKALAGDA